MYVDESGIHTYLTREYGRSPRGQPVKDVKRGSTFERLNVIAALCQGRHMAIRWYKKTTTAGFFEDWFTRCLLKEIPRGYTVIMDNAGFHRKKVLKKLARGKVRLLFLPPYSPDYNPIEKSWANMKRFLRGNASRFQSLLAALYDYFDIPFS